MFLAGFRETQDSLMTTKNPTPKLSEVDTTETAEAIKTLMAEEGCQNPFLPGHHIMWEDSDFCFFCSKKMKVVKIKVKG